MAIVARLLRGEPLELVVRETNVSIARLTEWREPSASEPPHRLRASTWQARTMPVHLSSSSPVSRRSPRRLSSS
jgi:hypothetical protein